MISSPHGRPEQFLPFHSFEEPYNGIAVSPFPCAKESGGHLLGHAGEPKRLLPSELLACCVLLHPAGLMSMHPMSPEYGRPVYVMNPRYVG